MERESYKLDPALSKPRYFGNPKAKVHKIPIFNLAMSACVFARLQYSLWFSKQSRQVCFLTQISIFEGYWQENNICVICPYFSIKSSSILDFELCDHFFLHNFLSEQSFEGGEVKSLSQTKFVYLEISCHLEDMDALRENLRERLSMLCYNL